MIRIAIPSAVTLVVVAAYVGASSWNRSREPLQTLVLTERELSLPWRSGGDDDDPGLQLALEVERRSDPLDAKNWLSEDRLRALGFALNVPPGSPEAVHRYENVPPRLGWVALEYDGPAFAEIERRRALRRESDGLRRSPGDRTRLVPVDAGPAFEPLRTKYSSNHLIVRAVIGLSYRGPNSGGPLVFGVLRELVPSTLAVPRHLRPVLEGLPPRTEAKQAGADSGMSPRYEAEVAGGPLGVLYLRRLRRIG